MLHGPWPHGSNSMLVADGVIGSGAAVRGSLPARLRGHRGEAARRPVCVRPRALALAQGVERGLQPEARTGRDVQPASLTSAEAKGSAPRVRERGRCRAPSPVQIDPAAAIAVDPLMRLPALRRELRSRIPPDGLCSFVCDGSPLDADVLIVGTNMSTSIRFWDCWDDRLGFVRERWRSLYDRARAGERNRVTPTRRIIDGIEEAVRPNRCLSANVFATPSPRPSDLSTEQRDTSLFSFLVTNGRARVVVVHGKEAASHLFEVLQWDREHRAVFVVPHFSRGWSRAEAGRLGDAIRAACEWVADPAVAKRTE